MLPSECSKQYFSFYPLKKEEENSNSIDKKSINPLSIFSRTDRFLALLCFLAALITFWSTVMPNVGLGDDGEMATAALHAGVPHPSGYPLWTITAGLFSKIIPFGNGSWKLNLFSGFSAALAVALLSLLTRSSACWLGMKREAANLLTIAVALTFAWCVPVWSQATIGKGTYSLHLLLMLVLTTLCYLWIRRPLWNRAFVWIVFSFSLGMSNHHMTLAMALLPLLLILLLYRSLFLEYTIYTLLVGSFFYLGFAALSSMPEVLKAALRLFYTSLMIFFFLLLCRKKFTHWKQGVLLLIAVTAGLLPYLYMPVASRTNPPMNWSYTSTREGFFYAINRSQYWGTLADQLQSTVGKIMGVPPMKKEKVLLSSAAESPTSLFFGFFKRFWIVLFKNISPLPLLLVFGALYLLPQQSPAKQSWFALLFLGFLLAAFFEPIMAPCGYDNATWDMQKPWQGLCYGFLLLLASQAAALLFGSLERRFSSRIAYLLLLAMGCMAIYTFTIGLPRSSQRGHWFGWMFGHDMLADLPKHSFIFGGTDPGRFIPTYMIFCESFEDPRYKRDPSFDRRDLYIVTQNALADQFYNQYIRSHYTHQRPSHFNWLERFLGRDHTYPEETLSLPNQEDIIGIYQNLSKQLEGTPTKAELQTNPALLNSAIAEWIFFHNRDQHQFFVEESFPMPWSYPYAIPHGLCYQINHDPLPNLSAEFVVADQQFWKNYIQRLRSTPGFANDEVAQHVFSKLRNTTGNIYAARGMRSEAELAYKQALDLWPSSVETVENLLNLLSAQERFEEASQLVLSALFIDPNSQALKKMKEIIDTRLRASREIPLLQERFNTEPTNRPLLRKLLQDYETLGDQKKIDPLIESALKKNPSDSNLIREMINFYASEHNIPKALALTEILAGLNCDQWDVPFTKAKYQLVLGKKEEALLSLQQAMKIGGQYARGAILQEPLFQQLTTNSTFQKLLQVP